MRVAIIGDYPIDVTQIHGGVQAAFTYLVNGLSQIDDLQIHILTLRGHNHAQHDPIMQNGVTVHRLPTFPRFELLRNYRVYQSRLDAKLAQIQPDILHAQDATIHAYVALRSNYPTVITVHGIRREDIKYGASFFIRIRNWLHNLLIERYNLKHTRYLIAISRYVTSYYASLLRPDVQVSHIPNAIDQCFFQLNDTTDGHTILYAGRIIPRKRTLDLVQAFAQIAGQNPLAQLRLAGEYSSEPAYAEAVRAFIREANLEDRVHLLGPLPEKAVWDEFAGCDVLALPSAQETTPMVIAQAMAAGKSVVATPVGGVTEMVKTGETGFLVEVGKIDALAEALQCLLQNPSLRKDMGEAGRKFAVENYRAEVVARRTHEVYQKITMMQKGRS
ncbi:MAG: glycosyltransferase family 4 protein [Anaerolineales bacterium]|nr:glycosyltransferase family 4 protein [Anaerolineales bacterium]